jgi:hypothetical protein
MRSVLWLEGYGQLVHHKCFYVSINSPQDGGLHSRQGHTMQLDNQFLHLNQCKLCH